MKRLPNKICICLGSPFHLSVLNEKKRVAWTVKNSCSKGNLAVFYLTTPISAIVGYGQIISEPWFESQSFWQDKYFAEIDKIVMFKKEKFIQIKTLRNLFPEWRYWLQPRQSVFVPEQLTKPFTELLENKTK